MVLPLIPLAMFGGGLFGGAGLSSLFGGGKKVPMTATTTSHVYSPTHAPQLQFAPVSTYGYQGATYIINSPGATSKKEQVMDIVSRPEQRGAWDFPIGVAQTPTMGGGTDLLPLVVIGAVALVVVTVLKNKKGGKK